MSRRPRRAVRDDAGFSLVEVLVAVSLLGLAVLGTLPAMSTSVRTSDLQRSFAGARQWIVAAGDHAVGGGAAAPTLVPMNCATSTTAAIVAGYEAAIRSATTESRPAGWATTRLTIRSIRFWNGTSFPATGCFETVSKPSLQLISLQVSSPTGDVVETLEVIKGGR